MKSLLLAMMALWIGAVPAAAEGRFALLIGNQNYDEKVGRLKNRKHDIALVGAELKKVGFTVTEVVDAGYKTIDTALRRHIQTVRRAGADTLSFVYYSGHGAVDPDTQTNYLIPVDVTNADDVDLWTNSIDLKEVVGRLREQSPDATHYVIFDACRDELRLTRAGRKALGKEKGFVPLVNTSGVMIAFSTAPGQTASDVGEKGGPYARALAEEIAKPGVESVMMFRNVQIKVKQEINQDPWLSFPTLPSVYFAGTKPTTPTLEQQAELAFWQSVKDSTSPAVVAAYIEKYPNGEFAPIARAMIEHLQRKMQAERAEQEERLRLLEEQRKAAEVDRLERERAAREQAIARERRKLDEGGQQDTAERKQLEEQQRKEILATTVELRKALEEAQAAREAARAAQEQREAALKAAEAAAKEADKAIAEKRNTERHTDPSKTAALPKAVRPAGGGSCASKTAGHRIFPAEPPRGVGALGDGEVAYVNDGQCGPGFVKQIIGGNSSQGRRIRCVAC
ncbi:MAG: caspase family protein [Hyphomicrobiaceae bacterium]